MKLEKFEEGNVEHVKSIENNLEAILPADYRNFLLENNGARIIEGSFHVKALDEDILLHILFGVKLEKRALNLEFWQKEYGDEIPEKSLLIGNDMGGAFILLIFDGENDGVYYYDHAFSYDQSSEDENTYFIAETFTSFLEMLNA